MSDWTYIVGETEYNQDFAIIDQPTGEIIDLTGTTLKMFIKSADLTTDYPAGGTTMSIVTVQNNTLARLKVLESFMPQAKGQYRAQIEITLSPTITKTYQMDLHVIGSLSS